VRTYSHLENQFHEIRDKSCSIKLFLAVFSPSLFLARPNVAIERNIQESLSRNFGGKGGEQNGLQRCEIQRALGEIKTYDPSFCSQQYLTYLT
jgi:hypothetical protein